MGASCALALREVRQVLQVTIAVSLPARHYYHFAVTRINDNENLHRAELTPNAAATKHTVRNIL